MARPYYECEHGYLAEACFHCRALRAESALAECREQLARAEKERDDCLDRLIACRLSNAGFEKLADDRGRERDEARSTLAAQTARVAALERALHEIANDPHCTPNMHSPSRAHDDQYRVGIADGHRCAASKARVALAALDREGEGEP